MEGSGGENKDSVASTVHLFFEHLIEMGKKRRSEPQEDEEEWGAGARALAEGGEGIAKREEKCRAHLQALNAQFAKCVCFFWGIPKHRREKIEEKKPPHLQTTAAAGARFLSHTTKAPRVQSKATYPVLSSISRNLARRDTRRTSHSVYTFLPPLFELNQIKKKKKLIPRIFSNRWVSDQLSTRPVKSWASGCQDYLKHVEQIKLDFKDVLVAQKGASDGPAAANLGAAKFVVPPVPTFGGGGAQDTSNSLFASFAAPPGDKPAAAPPSLFPNAASNPFMSSSGASPLFGGASTPAAAATPSPAAAGGFGFGAASTAPATGGLFGGVNVNTPSFLPPSTPAGATGGDDDDEPARPPSPSYQEKTRGVDDTEEALLKVKCKFFTKKDAKDPWADHGVNHLEFLREKEATEGVKRARVVCRNSIGKAVMNAGLYANMSVQIVDKKAPDGSAKKNGVIVNLFNAVEENCKTITLIRLGKEEDVLNLQKLFEDNVAAMTA